MLLTRINRIIFFFLVVFLVSSCQQQIGQIDLQQTPYGSLKVKLKKGEQVNFLTAITIEYNDTPAFYYNIEFYKGGEKVQQDNLVAPLEIKVKEAETKEVTDSIVQHHFSGKLDWHFIAKNSGDYEFKASIIKNKKPYLKIHQAKIFFVKKRFSKAAIL